jgi:hypothetical protein
MLQLWCLLPSLWSSLPPFFQGFFGSSLLVAVLFLSWSMKDERCNVQEGKSKEKEGVVYNAGHLKIKK